VADTPSIEPATRVSIKGVDAALAEQLGALQKEFPAARLAACAG
jgi:hypothetical protein